MTTFKTGDRVIVKGQSFDYRREDSIGVILHQVDIHYYRVRVGSTRTIVNDSFLEKLETKTEIWKEAVNHLGMDVIDIPLEDSQGLPFIDKEEGL